MGEVPVHNGRVHGPVRCLRYHVVQTEVLANLNNAANMAVERSRAGLVSIQGMLDIGDLARGFF